MCVCCSSAFCERILPRGPRSERVVRVPDLPAVKLGHVIAAREPVGRGNRVIHPGHHFVEILADRLARRRSIRCRARGQEFDDIERGRIEPVHRDLVIRKGLAVERVQNLGRPPQGVVRDCSRPVPRKNRPPGWPPSARTRSALPPMFRNRVPWKPGEEERPILAVVNAGNRQRSAYHAAELAALQLIAPRREEIARVEHGVAKETERSPWNLIAARPRDDVHHPARVLPVLGAVVAGLNAELLQCIGERKGRVDVGVLVHVVAAVQHVVDPVTRARRWRPR